MDGFAHGVVVLVVNHVTDVVTDDDGGGGGRPADALGNRTLAASGQFMSLGRMVVPSLVSEDARGGARAAGHAHERRERRADARAIGPPPRTRVQGMAWTNFVNTRLVIALRGGRTAAGAGGDGPAATSVRRRLCVAFSPHVPNESCEFLVTRYGVDGIEAG